MSFRVLAFSIVAILATACGGDSAGANNAAACREYLNTFNNLSCVPAASHLNADTYCNSYDATTCDISAYFDCLTDNTMCRDIGGISTIDTSGQAACASMATCN